MTERHTTDAAARAWVEKYLTAWGSNAESDIAALFEDDAEYRFDPWSPPQRGRDAIVAGWLEGADTAGTYTFTWDVIGIDGDRAFVEGRTVYAPDARQSAGTTYRNLWVIDLAADGRARSFTEWYMTEPSS